MQRGAPIADRVCNAAIVVFAGWTVCTHAVVALGGDFRTLLALAGTALAIGIVCAFAYSRVRARQDVETAPDAGPAAQRSPGALAVQALGLAAAATLALTTADSTAGAIRLWWAGVALLAVAAVPFVLFEAPATPAPLRDRRAELALWGIALGCAALAVCVHRPDLDDAFYVNVAVAAVDHAEWPLMSRDTLLGVTDLPMHQPAHRIHTYELFNGALAKLTGIPAILVFHWLAATLFGALLALAHARWFRRLTPRVWPFTLAALIVVLLAAGETHRWYGNFALVRMWQGKAVFLYVFMPLVYATAIEFALRPSAARWGLLAGAQIAAVGCSSTAIWAAPAGALIAMSCALRPTPAGLVRLLAGASASIYVLAIGFALKGDLQPLLAPLIETYPPGAQLARALRFALGTHALWTVGIAVIFGAWACQPRGLARRFAIVAPLAVWVVLLDPYLETWIAGNVTGPSFWRSLWALPVPALIALVIVAPLQWTGIAGSRRALGIAGCVLLGLAFATLVPRFGALSASNGGAGGVGIWVGRPEVKAPPEPYALARALDDAVPSGSVVVAPPDVGIWIPTFHGHAHPLQARRLYLGRHSAVLGEDDVRARVFMTRYAGGVTDVPHPHLLFAAGLRRFDVRGVLLRDSELAPRARTLLANAGFELVAQPRGHEVWVRRAAPAGGARAAD